MLIALIVWAILGISEWIFCARLMGKDMHLVHIFLGVPIFLLFGPVFTIARIF